jgi:hypothetical protein
MSIRDEARPKGEGRARRYCQLTAETPSYFLCIVWRAADALRVDAIRFVDVLRSSAAFSPFAALALASGLLGLIFLTAMFLSSLWLVVAATMRRSARPVCNGPDTCRVPEITLAHLEYVGART